ncbi:hypothetical protein CH63R_14559 [Colletotrichum higginsianum IMI 349063]|uniref:Uncharacterized protein n=1 Tax=Colletotrichum higginsianum (strain IMI 349063) TaxID=759273 RepID=A0A1B7XQF5_COLHI|nr:hypothetical protein CH63R_14559 [Colletotrichum higginsianum IMI 349063]OBR01987.1 hypothetical protein CH63R_14559 [Colletotrichum higginsianum IMI 349063]GJD05473.1 hypothetical protein ColKHC_14298 [Colletotrichum higginsianum]
MPLTPPCSPLGLSDALKALSTLGCARLVQSLRRAAARRCSMPYSFCVNMEESPRGSGGGGRSLSTESDEDLFDFGGEASETGVGLLKPASGSAHEAEHKVDSRRRPRYSSM